MKARLMSCFLVVCLLFTMLPAGAFAATAPKGAPLLEATVVGEDLVQTTVPLKEGTIVAPTYPGYEFKTAYVSTAKTGADRHYCNVARTHNGKVYYSYRANPSEAPLNAGVALKADEKIYLAYTKLNDAYSISTTVDHGGNAANSTNDVPVAVSKKEQRFTIKLNVARGYDVSVTATAGGKSCAVKPLTKKQTVFEISTAGIDASVNHIDLAIKYTPVSSRTVSIKDPAKVNWHHAVWIYDDNAPTINEDEWEQNVTNPFFGNVASSRYYELYYANQFWYDHNGKYSGDHTFKPGSGHNFTFYIHANPGLNVNYRLNSFSINGEYCRVPKIPNDPSIADKVNNSTNPEVLSQYIGHIFSLSKMPVTTTLSTGTEVTVRGIAASSMDSRPALVYRVDIANAYEDIEITDGNLNSLGWREVMVKDLVGVEAQAVYSPNGDFYDAPVGIPVSYYLDQREQIPFRFKVKTGYINPKVYLEGQEFPAGVERADGWTYVDIPHNPKLLYRELKIKAEPIKHKIKYVAGTYEENGQILDHFAVNMPVDDHEYDVTNSKVYISNRAPVETRDGWVFSHWKFTPHHGNTLPEGIKTEYYPGDVLDFGPFLKHGNMSQAVHTIKLTAVWTKSAEEKKHPYEVRYFFQDPTDGTFKEESDMTEFLIGSDGQTVHYIGDPAARIKGTAYEGKYTYSPEASTLSNVISGDSLTAVRVYYTNNQFNTQKSAALTYTAEAFNATGESVHGGAVIPMETKVPTNTYTETTYWHQNTIKPMPRGAIARAHEGYKFTGWFKRTDGAADQKVQESPIFIPPKNTEGFYDTTAYVAKFELNADKHKAPVIHAEDKTIYMGEPFGEAEAKAGVTATEFFNDKEVDISERIGIAVNRVQTDKAGDYKVEYAVTCEHGVLTTKEITVHVLPVTVDIEYYYQNEDGTYPKQASETAKDAVSTGVGSHTITPDESRTVNDVHYRFDESQNNIVSQTLAGNPDNPAFKLYYKRAYEDSATVTFRIKNGFWKDGGAQRRSVTVPLSPKDGTGTLNEKDVPQGMVPRAGYHNGAWDVQPDTTPGAIKGNVTYTYRFTEDTNLYTVTYTDGVENEEVFADQTTTDLRHGDLTPAFADGAPTRDGYTFAGWEPEVPLYVRGSATYTAQWEKLPPSGGGVATDKVTLHYESNGGTTYPDESYKRGTTVTLDKVPSREGYRFTGWYADSALSEAVSSVTLSAHTTVYAGWQQNTVPEMLNGSDHYAYMIGYPDGTVKPNNRITRAETASIFFRLLQADVRDGNLATDSSFADVPEKSWFTAPVCTMAGLGIIHGRTDAAFDPQAPITRAEFAAICARFDSGTTVGNSNFTDIDGHWAKQDIERAASLGWICGDPDGRFRPDDPITRAEAAALINRVLMRLPQSEQDLLTGMRVWVDNTPGSWYYLAIQEATNSHHYHKNDGVGERWTELTEDPDWSRYNDL